MPHAIELQKLQFEDLPRELIEEILSLMPTRSLVLASRTSKLLHDIASYIISRRLRHTLVSEGYKLVFDCHPAESAEKRQFQTCNYTSTELGVECSSRRSSPDSDYYYSEDEEECSPLSKLYSGFEPRDEEGETTEEEMMKVTVDSGEMFTQVCASASLVKNSKTGGGVYQSVIPVFESFFRVKRTYLDNAAESCGRRQDSVVWIGMGENVGLRLRVEGRKVVGPAVNGGVRGRDDEGECVEYGVGYEGLVVRSTYLLEMVEKRKHVSFFENVRLLGGGEWTDGLIMG